MAETKVSVDKLDETNYAVWKFRMELLLTKDELFSIVTDEKPEAPDAAWKIKDGKARALIGLALENSQLVHVMKSKTAKDMWDSLKKYHERTTFATKVHVLRKLITTRLPEGGNVSEHLANMRTLINKLNAMGEEFKDHWIAAMILASLPKSYDVLVTTLEGRPEEELTLEYVSGKLLDDWRRRTDGEESGEKAFKTAAGGKPKFHEVKRKVCHLCHEEGHFRRDCKLLLQAKKNEPKKKNNHRVNMAASSSREACFGIGVGDHVAEEKLWYLDSGATSHMTHDAGKLNRMDTRRKHSISLADGNEIEAHGVGSGQFFAKDGNGSATKVTLKEVYHVPKLKSNLLSVSKITDDDYEVIFDKHGCKIMKNEEVIVTGTRSGNLYHLDPSASHQALLTKEIHPKQCLHLWHKRLGHRDPEVIKKIVRENYGTGIQMTECAVNKTCGVCCEGKMSRLKFPKHSDTKTYAIGDLIHTDLVGPMEVPTPSGNRYYMVLLDDYSRYCIVYLLKYKEQAPEKMEEYINLLTNQHRCKPKIVRSDGGGEFCSNRMKQLFSEHGIIHQVTAPYTPQQNGKAERKNRYLNEMLRCLLAESGLQKRYWGEAVMTANYLQNLLPSSTMDTTPYEIWTGNKPSYSHLRVFGSEAYVHIPKEKRRKLDKKAEKLIFVGYAEGRKAYRFLDPSDNTVRISRDAKFLELESRDVEECSKERKSNEFEVYFGNDDHEVNLNENVEQGDVDVEKDDVYVEQDDADIEQGDVDIEQVNVEQEDIEQGDESFKSLSSAGEPNIDDDDSDAVQDVPRRSTRSTKGIPPERLTHEALLVRNLVELDDPVNLKQALESPDVSQWKAAMQDELESHRDNGTWELAPLPKGGKCIGCKWIFRRKLNAAGEVTKFKARLVAQGFTQRYGEDYQEIFAPVMNITTLRTFLAVASKRNLILKQLDVKTAYLYGELTEEIYMRQPPGHAVKGQEHLVCRLRRSIYGLKQSARCWNQRLRDVLVKIGFKQSKTDTCLYMKINGKKIIYLVVYVDDILVGAETEQEVQAVYAHLKKFFKLTDLGDLSYFLGLEVQRHDGNYSLSLKGYIERLADRFGMKNAKGAKTPMESGFVKTTDETKALESNTNFRSLIGALLYIATSARPDIAVCASVLGRKVSSPTEADWIAAKRVVRYLLATKEIKLHYGESSDLVAYSDADFAGDLSTRKSTTGFVFLYGGGAISWASRLQTSVTLSSMESEYVALSEACQEMIWIRNLLRDFGEQQDLPTKIMEDNQSCLSFVNSERTSRRSKHIETKQHYVKELTERNIIKLEYCPSEEMVADALTKPLDAVKLKKFVTRMGLF